MIFHEQIFFLMILEYLKLVYGYNRLFRNRDTFALYTWWNISIGIYQPLMSNFHKINLIKQ